MQLTYFEKGFNYSQDGPGNRLVYHMQGCNMHCPWCANPEGIPLQAPLLVETRHLLEEVCPYGAIRDQQLDRSLCATCPDQACLHDRRNQGIRIKATTVSQEEIWQEIWSSRSLFFAGGGVTLTGGEPTLQFEPVKALLRRCQENGINTAIETNATVTRLPELYEWIDHLILDVKHGNSDVLRKATSIGLEAIESNLSAAMRVQKDVLIRIPLVGGFNDDESSQQAFLQFMETFDRRLIRIECLRFHEYGRDKWVASGQEYLLDEHARIDNTRWKQWQQGLVAAGWTTIQT